MEQFKLKSIDELDLEFVSATRGQKAQAKSLIPEISKSEPAEKAQEPAVASYFQKPAQVLDEEPVYTPKAEDPKKKARPLVPIGQKPSPYTPVGAVEEEEKLDFSDSDYGEVYVEDEKKKGGKGAFAGKIIAIVLLCTTVVTFLFGCFVTIFLDNNGSDIGGICFNTMSQDIDDLGVSINDLIISKKVEASEYMSGDLIAVPSSTNERCDIQSVNYVNSYSTDAQLITTGISSYGNFSSSISSSECYGVVKFYIPALGGLLHFAMDNAILVCVLFVLLSALWCLLLVCFEKSSKSDTKSKTKK